MPFFAYEKQDKDSEWRFIRRGPRIDALPRRLLSPLFERLGSYPSTEAHKWALSEVEIHQRLTELRGPLAEGTYTLVIDATPDREDSISLFQVKQLFGCSYQEWTPLCLRLGPILDDKVSDPEKVKQALTVSKSYLKENIIEFLYIRKGFGAGEQGGTWNWGRVGIVNGALLYEDAWVYFVNECLNA